jgi:GT2 family glycosyltransferase
MSASPPSVLIITWKGGELLQRCLDSIAAQSLRPARVRVVLARPRPELLPPRVDALILDRPTDFAAAANAGLRALKGDVLLLNDDTEAHPELLAELWRARQAGGAGIYQPRILLADSGRLDNLGHRLFFDGFNIARGRGQPDPESLPADTCGAFSGAAVLLCGEVLERVGLFDERLGAFGEDLDLSLRAVRQGYSIRLVPDARIHHQLGGSYGRTGFKKVYRVERNRALAAVRSLPWTALVVSPLSTPTRLVRLAVLGNKGPAAGLGAGAVLATLSGGIAGVLGVPGALRRRREDRARWTRGEREMVGWLWAHRWREEGG